MKKIFIFLLIISSLIGVWLFLNTEETKKNPIFDTPTSQEQKAIEETQALPESIPESEMENLSPENAEHS